MPEIHVTLLGRFAMTVGGIPVAEAGWKRRHAAAVVKVLALAPGRRLHREQVIDLVWPADTIAEAVPKLHKAAYYARRAIGVPDSVVLRGDQVVLYPGGSVTVDAVQFEDLARRALAAGDAVAAREALALYGGELLPADRYEEWAETRREQLSQSHLDLLRLDGRWEAVAELDPGDERAHLARMRRHAANGDRHAALRQFDRLDRALRQELGLAPGPEASALRDRLLAAHDVFPHRDSPLIGRDLEISMAERAVLDAGAGVNRTLIISGEAGAGKSSLLAAIADRAAERGFLAGHGTAATASWAGQSTHQRLFLAAAELVKLAAAGKGVLLTVDDVHDADDGSLRLLHYLARSARGQRVCIVLGAAAFARALSSEAALLSGDLDLATAELAEASTAHQELGSAAGEAHSLQRLAEVRLAQGDDAEARRLLERALPLARSSIVAKHLLHRVFGTMIRAAASRPEAVQVAERAESMLGWDDFCQFCSI